jgi:hypothetical protein
MGPGADVGLGGHPQRGSNPCRRLERVPEQGRLPGM